MLVDSGADLIACETIPDFGEAEVLLELFEQTPRARGWISFSCRDGERIRDGTPLTACAALFDGCERVIAVGANCTAPRHIAALIGCVRRATPGKRVVVYPNSGEDYDGLRRTWTGGSEPSDLGAQARHWLERGATLIGGCCRTGPRHVRAIRDALTA